MAFQMPLFSKRQKSGWGCVDLVGISPKNLPVIIELKAGQSKESPLRMLLEAASYAIALRKIWSTPAAASSACFRDEWCEALNDAGIESADVKADPLAVCTIVCLAPEAYWRQHQSHFGHLMKVVDALSQPSLRIATTFAKLEFSAEAFSLTN